MLILALYFLHLAILPVFATDGNILVTYIGCYQDQKQDRILNGLSSVLNQPNPIHSRSNMTIMFCAESCHGLNFTYAGLERSSQCFCGSQVPILSLLNSACNMTCSGNSSQICGDRLKLSVYQMSELIEPLATLNISLSSQGITEGITPPPTATSSNSPVVALIVAGTSGAAILGLSMLMIVWRRRQSHKRLQRVPSSPVVDPQIRRSYRGTLERASSLAYNRMRYELRTPPPIYMSSAEPSSYDSTSAGYSVKGAGVGAMADDSGGGSFRLLPDSQNGGYTASRVDPRFPYSQFSSSASLAVPSVYSRVDSIEDSRDYTPRLIVRQIERESFE